MSAKPATVPEWATDANYPAGAETYSGTPTKVAPTGTRRSRGWEPKKKPPAQVENYERNLIGQWCQYLSDGELDGNHTIDGDLEITGDLDVTAGVLKYGERPTIPAADAEPWFAAASLEFHGAFWALNTDTTGLYYPVPLNYGDRLTSWTLAIADSGLGGHTARLIRFDASSNTTTPLGTLSTSTHIGFENLGNTGLSIDHTDLNFQYYILVVPSGNSGCVTYHARCLIARGFNL